MKKVLLIDKPLYCPYRSTIHNDCFHPGNKIVRGCNGEYSKFPRGCPLLTVMTAEEMEGDL